MGDAADTMKAEDEREEIQQEVLSIMRGFNHPLFEHFGKLFRHPDHPRLDTMPICTQACGVWVTVKDGRRNRSGFLRLYMSDGQPAPPETLKLIKAHLFTPPMDLPYGPHSPELRPRRKR